MTECMQWAIISAVVSCLSTLFLCCSVMQPNYKNFGPQWYSRSVDDFGPGGLDDYVSSNEDTGPK